MPPERTDFKYVWDMLDAARTVRDFVDGRSLCLPPHGMSRRSKGRNMPGPFGDAISGREHWSIPIYDCA